MSICGASLFGNGSKYIKVDGGAFVAIDGSTTAEKLIVSDLRMPYEQIMKGKIRLKPGQEDYLLNFLGLGDNATFLAIKVIYDPKSVIEEDNYILWRYYDQVCCNNLQTYNNMGQLLVLTGNSTHRIPQLFLTNPNTKYSVTLEIMIGVIDDEFSFFEYKPVVYFTNLVTLENAVYSGPYNTSLGNNFGATLSVSMSSYGGTVSVGDLVDIYVDEVLDSLGVVMSTTYSNYNLCDIDGNQIYGIQYGGTYSMTFDITDTLGNSVDPVDNIQIIVNTLGDYNSDFNNDFPIGTTFSN